MQDIILLNNMKFKGVKNLALFEISNLNVQIDLLKYDGLIFTSKNAIYALDEINPLWKSLPSYAIASKTAKVIKEYGGKVAFVGEKSHGNEFALEITPLLEGKKMLYVRAKKTVSKLCSILKEQNITVDELIAYETKCLKEAKEPLNKGSIIIFSSPSTVECFFKQYSWDQSFQAVVIGQTTAKYMPKGIKFHISPETSIEKCIELAQKLRF